MKVAETMRLTEKTVMHDNQTNTKRMRKMRGLLRTCALLALLIAGASGEVRAQARKPLLLRDPSVSKTQIAFSYAGNIWIASRDAGNVRRLTSGGHEGKPIFSPDGSQVAFTGDYDGTRGVYVVPAAGGEPRRLTYHPADFGVVFNRYYFAQVGKEAAIIDERYNGGGDIADYIIDYLRRPLLSYWTLREGKDITTPIEAIFGPKVMIINEMAGSGGDALPWMFRHTGIGPLIGKRTWVGFVGHYTNPADLIDGGFTGTPNLALYTTDGAWDVENHGVPPDIEVEYDPKLVRQGHDPQLEKAVEVVVEKLKENPLPTPHRPPYPNYQKAAH